MALNKNDLVKIKGVVLEAIEPMMVASQKEFDKIGGRLDKIDSDMKILKQGQEDIVLRLDNVAYRFELVALQKRVEVLEKRAGVKEFQK